MVVSTWAALTGGLDEEDLAKITAFREFCSSLPDAHERITSSQIAFAGRRIFTSAYIKSHYLEIGIELLRRASDPAPRTAFATTKTVIMHRYSLRHLEDFDEAIRALITEAAQTVGPGTR